MNVYLATMLAYVAYLAIVWFTGSLLQLQGSDLWVLRGALALIGLAGAVIFVLFYLRISKQKAAASGALPSAAARGDSETVRILRESEARLRSSKLGRKARLENLPVVFLLGDAGTAKTSCMVNSGLDTELLGGQVYEENNIIPTRSANLWYARNTVFLEAGSQAAEKSVWSSLLRRLQPGKIGSLRGRNAPRAAVVCFPCDVFFQPGAADALAAGVKRMRESLEEIARNLGISFPVYVLFTKADRIAFFAEFTGNLSSDEAAQVLGVTLPLRSATDLGVYAEQEAQRLNAVFNNLVLSLGDKRRDFLGREHDSRKLAGIYEFPRELRKLRSPAVQLLIDLCRPSPLRATPFLRGFYFSGVRAVVVSDAARPAVAVASAASPQFNLQTNATGIFKTDSAAARQAAIPRIVSSRKLPHWTFLTRFFSDVLLKDGVALAATAASVKTSALRRALLFAGTAACLLLSLLFTISYFGNRALEAEVAAAARGISTLQLPSAAVPPMSALTQLETLRQSVEKLSQHRKDGAPWRLRWGLYVGDDLYPHASRLYFSRFDQLLFGSTHARLLDFLKGLPPTPRPGDDYGVTYDSLRTYLITTSHHEQSSPASVSPVLMKWWTEGRSPDPETIAVVQKQFDFYSEELKAQNPFVLENDSSTIKRARDYLSEFKEADRAYQFMLAEASRRTSGVVFNKQFPGSSEVLINTREIPGAYTKTGWAFMQDAIKNADRSFSGEMWVLGEQGALGGDRAKLAQELTERYTAAFIGQWQEFLRAATIVRYTGLKDAATKLTKVSSNQSPLLAMMCLVAQNTDVDSPQIKAAFQPVHFLEAPAVCSEKYINEANTPYMNALVALNAVIEQMANTPGSAETLASQAMSNAVQAKVVTRQVAQNFRLDLQTRGEAAVQKLMEDPITHAESLIRNAGPAELNGKGKGLCTQFGELAMKYPFSSNATREATLQELNAIFHPQQGALWAFYQANLQALLTRQGSQYVAKADAPMSVNPVFLNFWNNVASFTDAIYPDGSVQPRLVYTLRPDRVEGSDNVTLTIDGQSVSGAREMVWSGNPNSEVKLSGGSGLAYTGLWAPFKFLGDADRWTRSGSGYTLEWTLRLGRATPLTIRFDLDMGKAGPVFQRSFLANLRCVAEIAR